VVAGDADDAALLSAALDVPPSEDEKDDDPARAHVHGFHTYPARMHPETASRLVRAFVPERGVVLDPFCGSGTVLVEAMVAGRGAIGTDLNPLAVRLARCKTRPRSPRELVALVETAREVAAFADERRKARAGATRRFPPEDVDLFEPHVLLELDSLRAGLEKLDVAAARPDLALVLSALLVKLSKKRGDTSDSVDKRRTAAGYTAKLFVKKTEELARRLGELTSIVRASHDHPTPGPAPQAGRGDRGRSSPALPAGRGPGGGVTRVELDDATTLRTIGRDEAIDAVITSPPYAATYDYVAHHALRLRWLGLDPRPLDAGEIGARRNYASLAPDEAHDAWSNELARFLDAIARVLPEGAPAVLLMADSVAGGVPLRADEIVASLARAHGFIPAARASQERPHFHGPTRNSFRDRPRAEHALLLRRAP
jgi:DNA modification methylase